jgi:L-lactate dehydrogenase complex protein LldG
VSARDEILRSVRAARLEPHARPESPAHSAAAGAPEERTRRFEAMLREAGGELRRSAPDEVASVVRSLPACARARSIVSFVPTALASTLSPLPGGGRARADVDFALFRGAIGVTENGAVWVDAEDAVQRATCFLAEHVALVLETRNLVADMHEAYARLAVRVPTFGSFLCGPSKTADIEQALVIGAHGPRSLAVVLVDERRDPRDASTPTRTP